VLCAASNNLKKQLKQEMKMKRLTALLIIVLFVSVAVGWNCQAYAAASETPESTETYPAEADDTPYFEEDAVEIHPEGAPGEPSDMEMIPENDSEENEPISSDGEVDTPDEG